MTYRLRLLSPLPVLLAVIVSCVCGGPAHGATTLTVNDAVARGLLKDETYLIAQQELERAAGQIREAWSGALPRLDLTGRYTRNIEKQTLVFEGESISIGSRNEYVFGLSLTQPLYVGGKIGSALKIAKFYREYAKHKVKQSRHDVRYEIKEVFFGARLAADVVDIYVDAIRQAELNVENVRKLFEQGMAAEFDLLRAEVELANLRPLLIRARNNAQISEMNLKNRLDIPLEEEIELLYEFEENNLSRTLDLESGIAHALAGHPALKQQEYLSKSYKKAIGIARADRMPQVFLSSDYQYAGRSDRFNPDSGEWSDGWSANLILSFPIFEGRAVSGRVKQAKVDYQQSASLRSQEKTIEQADEGVRIANLRYQNGVGTQLEVLSAQTASTQAKVNYINAVFDYELAVAAFDRAAGIEPNIPGVRNDE
jgi:outer membrane protein TolC